MTLQPPPTAPNSTPPPPLPPPANAPLPPEAPQEQEPVVMRPSSIWQHPFVVNVLPFLTSLSLHIGIIVIGVLTMQVVKLVREDVNKEQIIIPEAAMVESAPEGGLPHPGLGNDPTRDAAQDQFPDVPKDSRGIAQKPGTNLLPSANLEPAAAF